MKNMKIAASHWGPRNRVKADTAAPSITQQSGCTVTTLNIGTINCRFCATPLSHIFCDLGMSPISNAFIKPECSDDMEPLYPLRAYFCEQCGLVQTKDFKAPGEIFADYAYFSSYSKSWLEHARQYTETMIRLHNLSGAKRVVEIASNDGYLLQYFKQSGIPVLGVEPAANVAKVALAAGIPTVIKFFGTNTARELVRDGQQADLLLGNNVLAHVPDLNDFVSGMKILLKSDGLITMEFPHLANLIEQSQFDTIYHEHCSYLSLATVERIFSRHGLVIFDVDELETHGGSLRIYAKHCEDSGKAVSDRVARIKGHENELGLDKLETYTSFANKVREVKYSLLELLIKIKRQGKSVVGYGAPAKGNTLLNYCGIREDFLDYTVDASPHKQGCLLPGTHIPICHPDMIKETRPDYLLILPWNLKAEVMQQMAYIRQWGGKFVVPIPHVEVLG